MIHPHMTEKRRAYLEAVKAAGTYVPRHGIVASNCAVLDWTEAVFRDGDGRVAPASRMVDWTRIEYVGQRLTRKGRRALRNSA